MTTSWWQCLWRHDDSYYDDVMMTMIMMTSWQQCLWRHDNNYYDNVMTTMIMVLSWRQFLWRHDNNYYDDNYYGVNDYKCRSEMIESDPTIEKLTTVDLPDLAGAAGVSKCDGVPTCDTTLQPTINNPASTINFTATAANKYTQVMSTNPIVGKESSNKRPTCQRKSRRRRNMFSKTRNGQQSPNSLFVSYFIFLNVL